MAQTFNPTYWLRTHKAIFLLFCTVLFGVTSPEHAAAQKSPTTSLISKVDTGVAMSVEDTLVLLALNSPVYKSSEKQNKINEYQLRAAKNTWLNLLSVNANFNNQSALVQQPVPGTSGILPRYFFGVNIPLGTILSRTSVKAAREQVQISKNNQTQIARNIEADIRTKYKRYMNYSELLAIQNQALTDEETAYLQAKEKFRNGEITIELYNTAQKTYNLELVKKIDLQLQQDLLRIEIERIIGTSLNAVLAAKS